MTTTAQPTVAPGPCPDDASLRRLLGSGVERPAPSDPELDRLASHLDACPACQQRLLLYSTDTQLDSWLGRSPQATGPASDASEALFLSSLRLQLRKQGAERLPWNQPVPGLDSFTARRHRALRKASRVAELPPLAADRVPGYRIERCAGSGGMSLVYEATDLRLGRRVALKMFRADSERPHAALERLRREASVLAALNHPNIVPVYEVVPGVDPPVLVLEYIAGGSLARWAGGRPLPPTEAARAVATLAQAVQYAHDQGVVHRDLKPSNVLLKPREAGTSPAVDVTGAAAEPYRRAEPLTLEPYLLMIADFGLASWQDGAAGLTHSGQPIGTPAYMAPEQIEARTEAGPAQDLYALGVILYELLTGHPPLLADTLAATLQRIQQVEPVPPRLLQPGVPRDLETITLKCLEKEPRRRYATAAALAGDLERFLSHRPIAARPVRWPGRLGRWCRRNPLVAGLTALAAGLLLTLALGGWAAAVIQARLRREADAARQQALTNLDQSLNVYRDVLTELTHSAHAKDPQIKELWQNCLDSAAQWTEQYLQQIAPDAPWSLTDLRMARLLSQARYFTGQTAEAKDLARQILIQATRLFQEEPERPEIVQAYSAASMALGYYDAMDQQYARALARFEEACQQIRIYHQTHPLHEELLRQEFAIQGNQELVYRLSGRPADGIPPLEASIAGMRRILALGPERAQDLVDLADRSKRLALARLEQGRWADAEAACGAALAALDRVPASYPHQRAVQQHRSELARFQDQARRQVRPPAPGA